MVSSIVRIAENHHIINVEVIHRENVSGSCCGFLLSWCWLR